MLARRKTELITLLLKNGFRRRPGPRHPALAYQLWISQGREDGAAVEDWFDEEPELGFVNAKSTTA